MLFLTSSSSKKTLVGCVDDGVDLQLGDVAAEDRHFVRQIVAVAGEIFSRFLWNLKQTNFVFNFIQELNLFFEHWLTIVENPLSGFPKFASILTITFIQKRLKNYEEIV